MLRSCRWSSEQNRLIHAGRSPLTIMKGSNHMGNRDQSQSRKFRQDGASSYSVGALANSGGQRTGSPRNRGLVKSLVGLTLVGAMVVPVGLDATVANASPRAAASQSVVAKKAPAAKRAVASRKAPVAKRAVASRKAPVAKRAVASKSATRKSPVAKRAVAQQAAANGSGNGTARQAAPANKPRRQSVPVAPVDGGGGSGACIIVDVVGFKHVLYHSDFG